MKRVNKKRKIKNIVPLAILFATILILSAVLLIYIYTQNYITVEYIDKSAEKTSSKDVTSISPIIINNVVIGGVSDKGKWISKDNIDETMNVSKGAEIDMYSISGKMGTFEIYSKSTYDMKNLNYIVPFKELGNEEYIAVLKSDSDIMKRKINEITPSEEDEKYVKKALGKYRLLNNSVKVNEAYEVYLTSEQKTRIICATSTGNNKFGVYSVVIYARGNDVGIIKYSYVKNTKSSVNWPVYSIKFVCDLNKDDSYEIVLQEARETSMKYSIMEYNKGKYYEVLGLKFDIK